MRLTKLLFLCLLLLTLAPFQLLAQDAQPTIKLVWNEQVAVFPSPGLSDKLPAFQGASIDYIERLPYYKLQLHGLHISNLFLKETTYTAFTPDEQKAFTIAAIGAEPAVHINRAVQHKEAVSIISILPVRRNPQTGQLEKLTSFSYTYTTAATASQARLASTQGSFTTASVLSTGNWYKLAVTNSGIYKIDKTVLQALGINPQQLDPRKIQIYGNGGGMLPQSNAALRPDDLIENAIEVVGESDGRFDDSDYVLFYAQGPHTWQFDQNQQLFKHNYNIYSDSAFYFLRVDFEAGKRITSRGQTVGATQTITSFNDRQFCEKDIKNMVFSGREWYGEEFSSFTTSREVSFQASDLIPGSAVKLTAALMANSATNCSFSLKLNGQQLGSITIPNRGTFDYHPEGVDRVNTYSINQQQLGTGAVLKTTIEFNTGGSSTSLGYLNSLVLNTKRQLKLYGDQSSFRSLASLAAPISTFRISGTTNATSVWDVTNSQQPLKQETTGTTDISFSAPTSILREFVAFNQSSSLKPIALGKVANQSLHSENLDGTLDFVIVAHPQFLQEANRLAQHRRQQQKMNVLVVTPSQIYNEFSSGAQDVTAIRDFMRMLYSRSTKPSGEPLYLLLFGDTSYDYKNRIYNNTNFVPVYQSRQSLHPITSYSSEDYYGFLDENEGEWEETSLGDHLLDIGIGRLPAKTATEAATMVNKIIAYESPEHFGKWRSQISLVADDGDNYEHQNDAEFLANYMQQEHPDYYANKVYLDLYPQTGVASGQRSPEATAAVDKAVEQGSLILNYTGHGNEISWAKEQLLTPAQISAWRNSQKLTFMLTATCEFGRYDDPARSSGAELALLQPQGGAVGLITTTRPVYSNGNRALNRNFFKSVFTPTNGRMPCLGDLVLLTKNNSITDNVSGSRGVNNRNFTLLSDPSMQLAYPDAEAIITHINGRAATTDTLSALGKITIAGQVQQSSGTMLSNFNGNIRVTVYEKEQTRTTYADEASQPVPVKQRDLVIYDGQASVANGVFQSSFVVPKDINYTYGTGKISLYATSDKQDALGSNTSIVIGGTAKTAATDNVPPTIKLYMNDESFVFGGATNADVMLLVKLNDESGINTAGLGIGHEITAVLDGKTDNLVTLNDYYTSDKDSYQSGTISYPLKGLAAGRHTLKVKAWDTHNNSAEEYIEFIVSNDNNFSLYHVLNHPNPFSTNTRFHFDHNRAGEDIEVQIQIYTISGKLIKTLETTSYASKAHIAELSWDGRDEYNDVLARGVYIYKLNVRSKQDGSKTSKFEKLVILN
ncbi:type IX secretion system sortase PorU [Pontibacter harenae]|uniref:type IX secretion system sortase PorU n=1 Tax=Pontibacter harenae TaxID=2894083 RepID=UPI001E4D0598|nr:type IX secretion system sortase PorU [Pontibacter harenae]MCC9166655.1 type IX secretion system sortase PorU [Pontibacter harenae]